MGTSSLRSHFCVPNLSHLTTITTKTPPCYLPLKTTSRLTQKVKIAKYKQSHVQKPIILETKIGNSLQKNLVLGAVSIGFMLFLLGLDDHKALALGPEGPLMEEFWDNMRRYGLYALTVSSGVASAIFEPILELMRNPITAVLVVVIFGGSFYIVSQVLSAMVGVSEFNYEYGY